jgi:hypothetical protein
MFWTFVVVNLVVLITLFALWKDLGIKYSYAPLLAGIDMVALNLQGALIFAGALCIALSLRPFSQKWFAPVSRYLRKRKVSYIFARAQEITGDSRYGACREEMCRRIDAGEDLSWQDTTSFFKEYQLQ